MHSDKKVAELQATGRVFMREHYSFGNVPTYRVLNDAGEQVGIEFYWYEIDQENDRRVETIFTSEQALMERVLDVWRPASREDQDTYCRYARTYR